jgi:hypothetical protein
MIHRYFVVCLVGVWQRNFEPVVRVYGTAVRITMHGAKNKFRELESLVELSEETK